MDRRAFLVDARWAGLFVGGVVLAGGAGYVYSFWLQRNASTAIAVAGVVLQGLGMSALAYKFADLRRYYHRPSWASLLRSALQRAKDLHVVVPAEVLSMTGHAGVVMIGAVANATDEQRLTALEATVAQLRVEAQERTRAVAETVEAVKRDLRREADELAAAIRGALDRIEDVAVGGLQLEEIALGWLLLGMVCTSLPGEVAVWLRGLL